MALIMGTFNMCILILCSLMLNVNDAHAPFSSIYTSTILSRGIDANSTGSISSMNTTPGVTTVTPIISSGSVTSTTKGNVSQPALTRRLMVVSFVNGIYHTEDEWRNLTQSLSEVFSSQVRAFYNPSSGTAFFNWVQDAAKAGYELMRRPNDLDLAKRLAEHLRNILEEVGPTGRVLHLAHSGGAILTYLAAKYHLTSQETDRIDLATFGGGRSITRKYFKGRIVNYYSRNDPLTLVDGRAGALMKHAVSRHDSGKSNNSYWEVRDRKHNTTFVYLHGLADNPLIDHSMFGPTYERALRIEAANFKQRLSMMTAAVTIAEANWMRKVRKSAAKLTGMRHFWGDSASTLQSSVRIVRKRAAKITNQRGYFSKKTSVVSNMTTILGNKGAIDNASSTSSIGWRAAWMQRAATRLGRFYPSSLLPAVSSSEPWLDNAEVKLRSISDTITSIQSTTKSSMFVAFNATGRVQALVRSNVTATVSKYTDMLKSRIASSGATANRILQAQRDRYKSLGSLFKSYWSQSSSLQEVVGTDLPTIDLPSPVESDIEVVQAIDEAAVEAQESFIFSESTDGQGLQQREGESAEAGISPAAPTTESDASAAELEQVCELPDAHAVSEESETTVIPPSSENESGVAVPASAESEGTTPMREAGEAGDGAVGEGETASGER